jgi:peptide-methionine (S)-S-oxide reductase
MQENKALIHLDLSKYIIMDSSLQLATFGAGCFWGVEETFRKIPGVVETAVGYEGGNTVNPSYEDVCYKNTNHAEVVQVTYDPSQVSYEKLLEVFWNNHNPTTYNRQGPDVGSQYRSVIFFHNSKQQELAEQSKVALEASGKFARPIVTQIVPAETFYKAEEYHQKYLAKLGKDSCHL